QLRDSGRAARRPAAVGDRAGARDPLGTGARRAVARRPAVAERHAHGTAAPARTVPDSGRRRSAAPAPVRSRRGSHDAARGADVSRGTEAGGMTSKRAVLSALGQPKVAVMLMLGFSSGLPFFLTGNTLGYWMRDEGTTLSAIGFLSWVGLAYSLKFLWAPIID